MQRNKKGFVLVMAIMISIILIILSGAVITAVNYSTQSTSEIINSTERYWAAHAGAEYLKVWFKSVEAEDLAEGGDGGHSLPNNLPDPDDKIKVDVTLSSSHTLADGWDLLSTAKDNGKQIVIKQLGTTVTTYFKFGELINSLGSNDTGGGWADGYNFWGDIFVNDVIKIQGTPIFHGNVSCYSNGFESYGKNYDFTNPKYTNGLSDWSDEHEDDGWLIGSFKGKYEGNHSYVNLPSAAMTWDEIKASDLDRLDIVAGNQAVDIVFNNNTFSFKIGNSAPITKNIADYDVIAIADIDNSSRHVGVKGNLTGNISIATQRSSVRITGDLYYDCLNKFAGMTTTDFLTNDLYSNIDQGEYTVGEIDKVMEDNYTDFCAILVGMDLDRTYENSYDSNNKPVFNGQGQMIIEQNDNTDNATTATPLLVSAGMFSPHGSIVADYPKEWKNAIPLITYGSIIADAEGWTSSSFADEFERLTRDSRDPNYFTPEEGKYLLNYTDRWGRTWYYLAKLVTPAHNVGIAMNPMTDWRFKSGMGPKVFNNAVNADGTNELNVTNWEIERSCY